MTKINNSFWQPAEQLVTTRLSGLLDTADIEYWENTLIETMKQVPDHTEVKMLVDLHGFKAENFEVHKQYRNIIPLLLARHGYRIGYLDIFPEASISLTTERNIRVVAMANVHQDETKMKDYQEKFSKPYEQYFTDSAAALAWILSVKLN
jgi:hypothetical protein